MKKINGETKMIRSKNSKKVFSKKHETENSQEIELPGNMNYKQTDGWHASDEFELIFSRKLDQVHILENHEIRLTDIKISYPDNQVVIVKIELLKNTFPSTLSWFLFGESAQQAKQTKARLYKDKNYREAFKFCDKIAKKYIKEALRSFKINL